MSQNLGIEVLIDKRQGLITERDNAMVRFNDDIAEIESCIEQLSGKPFKETVSDFKFDDENPNYIKASQEEM